MLVTPLGKSAVISISLWRHNESDSVLNHQPDDCLLKRVFTSRSMDTSKPLVTSLCEGNSLVTDEFPAQMASKAENVSIWWRHHVWFHFPEVDKEHGWCITSMHEIVTHRKLRKLLAFEKKTAKLIGTLGSKYKAATEISFRETFGGPKVNTESVNGRHRLVKQNWFRLPKIKQCYD